MQADLEGREDRNGGILYNRYDRVRTEQLWRQTLATEQESKRSADDANMAAYGSVMNFQMNMANQNASGGAPALKYSHNRLEVVTEKEIKQSPQERSGKQGVGDPNAMEVMAIQHLNKGPTQKWDVNCTASQEIGWLLANPVRSHSLVPASGKANSRHLERMRRQGLDASQLVFSQKSTSMPTSERAMTRIRSAPHIAGGGPHEAIGVLNSQRWRRPKNKCDVTGYAETYMHLMKHDPFNKAMAGR